MPAPRCAIGGEVGQVVQASISSRDDADSLPGGLPDGRSRRSAGLGSPPARRHEPDRRDHKGDDHRNGEEAGSARDLDGIGARWAVVLQVLEQEGDDRDQPQEAADQDDDNGPDTPGRGSSAMRRGDRMTPVLPGPPVPPSQLAGGRWVGVPARKGGGRRGVDAVRRRARYGWPEPSPAERPRHDGEFVTPNASGGRARPRPPGRRCQLRAPSDHLRVGSRRYASPEAVSTDLIVIHSLAASRVTSVLSHHPLVGAEVLLRRRRTSSSEQLRCRPAPARRTAETLAMAAIESERDATRRKDQPRL